MPYVSSRVTSAALALAAHRHSFTAPRCRNQDRRIVVPLSVSQWNDLNGPAFDGVGLAVLKAHPMLLCWPNLLFVCALHYFLFLFLPCG